MNITSLESRNDVVLPILSMGAEDAQPYGEYVDFNCTIPGMDMTETRRQQCVFDQTTEMYNLVGDSLECKSKKYIILSSFVKQTLTFSKIV